MDFSSQNSSSAFSSYSHQDHLDSMGPSEKIDIEILQSILPRYYKPESNPWSMVVGASAVREPTMIREFHRNSFAIDPDNSTVVGCTINLSGQPVLLGDYNQVLAGKLDGDAQDSFTWMRPFLEKRAERFQYDLVMIRHPDLVNLTVWESLYRRALEHISSNGAVVTMIRKGDGAKFDALCSKLKKFDISPVDSSDNINRDYLQKNSAHDQVAVFVR